MKYSAILLITFILLVPQKQYAQGMPVYDNTNFISLVKQLLESGKQTANLVKTVNFLKQQKENIEKVNDVVKQLQAVRRITANNKKLITMVQQDMRAIVSSPYIRESEIEKVTRSFESILNQSLETMDLIDQVLSSDMLKMTDAERAAILQQREAHSREMIAGLEVKTRRYQEIISFRKMQELMNNRENAY